MCEISSHSSTPNDSRFRVLPHAHPTWSRRLYFSFSRKCCTRYSLFYV